MSYRGLWWIGTWLFDFIDDEHVIDVNRVDPIVTKIGNVTATGDGISDDAAEIEISATLEITAEYDGDATDVIYEWSYVSGDPPAIKFNGAKNKANATIQGQAEGEASITCKLTSAKSDDSPQSVTVTVTVTTTDEDPQDEQGAVTRKR